MNFTCPHCNSKTITAWQKYNTGPLSSKACTACGERHRQTRWSIPANLIALLFLFFLTNPVSTKEYFGLAFLFIIITASIRLGFPLVHCQEQESD